MVVLRGEGGWASTLFVVLPLDGYEQNLGLGLIRSGEIS